MQQFEGALKQCVTVPLAQHEYDALVSFSYNVGSRAFCLSTLVRKLNAEDYPGACREILRWTYFQGKNCAAPANARLHDAAAEGRLPEPARDADADAAGIALSAVARTVAANYQTCHENAEQLRALQAWVSEMASTTKWSALGDFATPDRSIRMRLASSPDSAFMTSVPTTEH